ncbi:MAG: TlpA family protein disulfide reductase [Candidatus Omnitrophica bacterium]|nr:TlpA family protein disulfide reductase [Candidatus Omnitrophota bacterium]
MRFWRRCGLVWLVAGAACISADEIRFKDGQVISGTLVDDGDTIAIVVPRNAIAQVNGQSFESPPAPPFTAVDVTGATHSVPDSKKRVTLLKFWASWCPFCRSDIPLMKEVFERYRDQGLRLLTVSVDQDRQKLDAFMQTEPLPYPVIPTAGDGVPAEQVAIASLYQYQGIPAYFVIDANGAIVKRFSGSLSRQKANLEAVLTPLLASAKSKR